ncbi:MAG TPA: hypothetical protein DCZ94_17440 [Lentisphaeria bacterium]|nr:MAG: hypothetical protein A2X48_13370 [Lentisphaerae bacterium GWF2_49_21]HBC88728.1 hypothetical protein [Lentisphaeria bacterium]
MAASKKASNSEILKQVIYEMLNLAYLVEILGKNRCFKGQSRVESNDVILSAVAVKFRLLYDFLYSKKAKASNEHSVDAFSAQDNFNTTIRKPEFAGLDSTGMFTSESVSKYLVHFTEERISKPKELLQPRFKGGNETYIKNSSLILASAEKFVDALAKGDCMNINLESENCMKDFKKAIERLKEVAQFKESYVV